MVLNSLTVSNFSLYQIACYCNWSTSLALDFIRKNCCLQIQNFIPLVVTLLTPFVHTYYQGCHNVRKARKNKKKDKSPEKSGENGGFREKVMKSQEIWYKNATNDKYMIFRVEISFWAANFFIQIFNTFFRFFSMIPKHI